MSDPCGICYHRLQKWRTKGGLSKTPLGYGELNLLIIQSNLIVQYGMAGFHRDHENFISVGTKRV